MDALLLKQGDRYTAEHVNRVARQVLSQGIYVVCYTDDPTGVQCETREIPTWAHPDVRGWWWKLWLFGRARGLYLDLDVEVVNDLGGMDLPEWRAIPDPWRHGWNTSVVRIPDPDPSLWSRFLEERPDRNARGCVGDQEYFTAWMGDRVLAWPEGWCISYKHHVLGHKNPEDPQPVPGSCRVVYFHGSPKPWEVDRASLARQGQAPRGRAGG